MKCRVLVAEDELIERKVLCKTLQRYLGDLIFLYEAKNGREAVEIFEREAPQVAILDIEAGPARAGGGPQDTGDRQTLRHPLFDGLR